MTRKRKAELRAIEPEPPVSPDVADGLTELCNLVQQDKVSSVAIAIVYRDGSCGHVASTPPSWSALIGAITRMLWALTRIAEDG